MNKEYYKKQLTIPNFLTTIRLLAIPYMVYLLIQNNQMNKAFFFFILIWATDILDGFIARNFNQTSDLGKIYDPLVDKLFQIATAVALYYSGRLPDWVLFFMIIKELVMVCGSFLLLRKRTIVHSQWFGKLATVLYTFAFVTAFLLPPSFFYLLHYLFLLPTICSFLALFMYGFYYQHDLQEQRKEDING